MKQMNKNDGFSINFTKIPNSIIRDPYLSPYAKTIYMVIRSYSPSFPSYSHILKETGIGSRSTISKGLNELKAKRLVRVIESANHKSNLYEFLLPPKMDSPIPLDVLPEVQEVDTNKTNLIIPNNKASKPSTVGAVDDFKREEIFSELHTSLGTPANSKYGPPERPTFFVEALE